ncbi:hypothetical protein GIB67_000897 [Kingdonia uniflora]|uniref:Uncharacterized protein n=1 Tax=Kingdonia uniflora TaxID=39325 RepID=A0A7J7M2M0_9MAGN|nr:hypothetical protein GIB67_000897 [Kingdonia uniflora]
MQYQATFTRTPRVELVRHNFHLDLPSSSVSCLPLGNKAAQSLRRHSSLLNKHSLSKLNEKFSVYCSDQLQSNFLDVDATNSQSLHTAFCPPVSNGVTDSLKERRTSSKMFRNKFLNFARLGSIVNGAAESFFKSEIRRRLFVTAVLLIVSRIGYFIPLPGFDRRLIPENYLSFVSGSVGKLLILFLLSSLY